MRPSLAPSFHLFRQACFVLLASCLIWLGLWPATHTSWGQVAYDLSVSTPSENTATNTTPPTSDTIRINQWDQARPANSVVLYTPQYGPTTRTNPYGVEWTGIKTDTPNVYTLQPNPSVNTCLGGSGLADCGNSPIPKDGMVFSSHGNKRILFTPFEPGALATLTPRWFDHATRGVSVVNPNYGNNARYCSFPGCRGSGQLVIYTPAIGRVHTGTNEFGFEATIVGNRVVAHEGSDSTIPTNGFVLSGHGSSRDWLIKHAPIGALVDVSPDGRLLTTTVDLDTYRIQLENRLTHAEARRLCGSWFLPRRDDDNPCVQIKAKQEELAGVLTGDSAEEAAQTYHQLEQELNEQIWTSHMPFEEGAIRGIWHRPTEQSRAEIQRTLDFLKNSGLNTVFLETFFHGYTMFPSETMAKYGLPEKNPRFPTLPDPLAVWVEEAHQRGIQIHPWMEVFYVGNKVAPPKNDAIEGPIISKYPQWANISYAGRHAGKPSMATLERGAYFLDPANDEVHTFLTQLMTEAATRYEIDGLQLDYIRYPSSLPKSPLYSSWGYTAAARAKFKAQTGTDPNQFGSAGSSTWYAWQRFRMDQVSRLVASVRQSLKENVTRDNFVLSAAVFPREAESIQRKQQDWGHWVKQGWIDMLCPMTLTSSIKAIASDVGHMVSVRNRLNRDVKVVSGLFGPFNGNEADLILDQIDVAHHHQADGFSLFDSAHLTGRVGKAIQLSQEK